MKTNRKATLNPTSTPNFFDVVSSNGWDHYPLMMTGPGACRCGCPAGEANRACYHRSWALQTLEYIPVVDDTIDETTWQRIENLIEWESILDDVRTLFEDGPRAA